MIYEEDRICALCGEKITSPNDWYIENDEGEAAHDECLRNLEFWEMVRWMGHPLQRAGAKRIAG